MKTATVADLRNHFRKVATWIEHGETVQILKRGKPFAQLSSIAAIQPEGAKPDIMEQLRNVWGTRKFSMAEVKAMKDSEMGEDGE